MTAPAAAIATARFRMALPSTRATLSVPLPAGGPRWLSPTTLGESGQPDVAKMRSLISDIAAAHPAFADARTLEQKEAGVPAVNIRIDDFLETGMLVTCVIHMKSYDASFDASSDIRAAIQEAFKQNGISFAAYRIDQVNKA